MYVIYVMTQFLTQFLSLQNIVSSAVYPLLACLISSK
jgi:hypothetical protein